MARLAQSTKQLKINKANTTMVVAIAVSSFIVVFSLVACRALLSQRAYQSRVISKKEQARNTLKANLAASDTLITTYKGFVGTSENVLGGNPTGTGDKDGDNAKIILDALPSKYDFPALATSLEKLLAQNSIKINSISGVDDELAQTQKEATSQPQTVDMPFTANVAGNYAQVQKLIALLERSIRPIHINSLNFSGSDNNLTLTVTAKTYYQPEKDLTIRTEVVK